MGSLPEIFVGNIGLSSLTLCGVNCRRYLTLPHSRLVRECVIVECYTESDLIDLLQSFIDDSIPFESTYKSDPARVVLLYREQGRLKGRITSFDWGAGGAIYEEK